MIETDEVSEQLCGFTPHERKGCCEAVCPLRGFIHRLWWLAQTSTENLPFIRYSGYIKGRRNDAMSKRRDVIYENGVFRPLEPVDVPEHQRMTIMIPEVSMLPAEEDLLDTEYERWVATQVKEDVSLETVRQVLSKIPGSLTADFLAERAEP
jgi:predicted DNA-binding antitoxin AbrB/MazE fold protein